MRIREVMTHPAVTCPLNVNLDAAARLMWEYDCGIIPVVDDNGQLAGVVTDRDICMAGYTQGRPLASIPVTSAMASRVFSVRAEDALETAEDVMRMNQVRRVPVIDADGRPVGVVAMNDLVRLAAHTKKGALDRSVIDTLAAVCQPRSPVLTSAVSQRPVAAA